MNNLTFLAVRFATRVAQLVLVLVAAGIVSYAIIHQVDALGWAATIIGVAAAVFAIYAMEPI